MTVRGYCLCFDRTVYVKTDINCSFKAFAFWRSVDDGILEVADSVGMPMFPFLKALYV